MFSILKHSFVYPYRFKKIPTEIFFVHTKSTCFRSTRKRVKKPAVDAEEACRKVFGDDLVDQAIKEKEEEQRKSASNDDVITPNIPEDAEKNPFDMTDAEEDYYRRAFRACDANNSGGRPSNHMKSGTM